jgi:hypothetical protein
VHPGGILYRGRRYGIAWALVSLEDISCIYFILHVVQGGVVTIGNDGLDGTLAEVVTVRLHGKTV